MATLMLRNAPVLAGVLSSVVVRPRPRALR